MSLFYPILRRLALVALLALSTLGYTYEFEVSTPEAAGYDPDKLASLNAIAEELYRDGRIPNYVIALYKDNKQFYKASKGLTGLAQGQPVDGSTIYHMASMSKPIVSTAIFRLIQEGKLSFDDPLTKFFPQFSLMMVAPEGDFSNQFEPAEKEITILDLLTHTSGLSYNETVAGFGDVGRQYSELGIFSAGVQRTLVEHIDVLAEIPLVAQPGSEFNYSVGIDVLGAIIEQITEKTLAAYLKETIFDPLGMSNTAFYLTPDQAQNMASIFGMEPVAPQFPFEILGRLSPEPDATDWKIGGVIPASNFVKEPSFYSGGGGILSSANDYARYLTMIANGGEIDGVRILDEEYASMHQASLVPGLTSDAFRSAFGDAAEYMTFGGGFGIKREPDNDDFVDYIFWAGAFNTFFWVDTKDNSIGLFLTAHWPVQYNISDQLEEIVDEARL
tara:strand:+ start:4633 stop:5967 length:1335 start_codon:yes stop_codon:yes gene_type:complete